MTTSDDKAMELAERIVRTARLDVEVDGAGEDAETTVTAIPSWDVHAIADILRPHLKPEWRPIETAPELQNVLVFGHSINPYVAFKDLSDDPVWRYQDGDAIERTPLGWQPLPDPPKGES